MKNNRLKELRKNKYLSQKDLAKVMNISNSEYSNYENGLRSIPTKNLITLANFYNTSVDYLLGLTNSNIPYPKIKS